MSFCNPIARCSPSVNIDLSNSLEHLKELRKVGCCDLNL